MQSDLDPATESIVVICWLLFVTVWIAGWIYNLARAPKTEKRRLSPWILLGGVAAYAISWLVPANVWAAVAFDHPFLRELGIALVVAGSAFAIWARFTLGTMWSGIPLQRAGHRLITNGPFAVTRHPIYTGFLAMLAGTALVYGGGSWIGPVVAASVALFFKIRDEEKLMLETFGGEYEAYRARVGAIVPWVRDPIAH